MKVLQFANAAVLAFGLAMSLILGVVCVLYAVHVDDAPRLRADLPYLYGATGLFFGLALAGAAAFFGQRRGWPGRWLLQVLPLAPVAALGAFLLSLRG